jgi:hypothetical protein
MVRPIQAASDALSIVSILLLMFVLSLAYFPYLLRSLSLGSDLIR